MFHVAVKRAIIARAACCKLRCSRLINSSSSKLHLALELFVTFTLSSLTLTGSALLSYHRWVHGHSLRSGSCATRLQLGPLLHRFIENGSSWSTGRLRSPRFVCEPVPRTPHQTPSLSSGVMLAPAFKTLVSNVSHPSVLCECASQDCVGNRHVHGMAVYLQR